MKERRLMLIRVSKELIRRSKAFLFSMIKNVLELWVIDCRCKTVNIPKTAEIHTLKFCLPCFWGEKAYVISQRI